VAADRAVCTTLVTAMGVEVHHPVGGSATALFLLRLPVWEIALAVTEQGTALGVVVPPLQFSRGWCFRCFALSGTR
jgi:hypothetical protein